MEEYKFKILQTENFLKTESLLYDTCIIKTIESTYQYKLDSDQVQVLLTKCDEHKNKVDRLLQQLKEANSYIREIN